MFSVRDLPHPLMNGAGCVKTVEEVERMARSAVSTVVAGSFTLEQRDGNAGDTFANHGSYAVNALGLPNGGAKYLSEGHRLNSMICACEEQDKTLIVSLAGLSSLEWHQLFLLCQAYGPHGVELNFGCPNVQEHHPIWSFDPMGMQNVMRDALETMRGIAIGVKFSPFSNPADLKEAAACIPHGIDWVTTSNTFPNVPGMGISKIFGGMSGPNLKPIALGQVYQFRNLLDASVNVVGVGGIDSQLDIDDFRAAGATAVQATTAYWKRNQDPMVFSDILAR